MIRVSRLQLVSVTYLFGLFHATLGIFWSAGYASRQMGFLAVGLYVVALSMTILMHRGLNIPMWQGLYNMLTAAIITQIIESQLSAENFGTYATWYVGGLGVLLGATALRGQYYWAIGGALFAVFQIAIFEGLEHLGPSGVVGMIVLVAVGTATSIGMQNSDEAIASYTRETQEAALSLRRKQVQRQMQNKNFFGSQEEVTRMLEKIISSKGKLHEDVRDEAKQLEARLSDAVMGGKLVSPAVSAAARAARSRGIEAFFIDEGGLDKMDELEVAEVQNHIIEVLNNQRSGKVTVRATTKTQWRVSIIAFEKRSSVPNVDWKF